MPLNPKTKKKKRKASQQKRKQRDFQNNPSDDVKTLKKIWPLGLFFVAIGIYLLIVRDQGQTQIQSGTEWRRVSCVIVQNTSTSDFSGNLFPNILYQYEVNGVEYQSDRLKFTPGNSGTDNAWNHKIIQSNPVGTKANCYVNPDNPQEAVFDRDHGRTGQGSLLVLGRIWLVIGLFVTIASSVAIFRDSQTRREDQVDLNRKSPAPRVISFLLLLTFLFRTPRFIQTGWACLICMAIFFNVVKGPELFRLRKSPTLKPWVGEVTGGQSAGVEYNREVYRFIFKYQWKGEVYFGQSLPVNKVPEVGVEVAILINPTFPELAKVAKSQLPNIGNQRSSEIPAWIGVFVLMVMALPGLGVIGTTWFNLRICSLLKNGQLKRATKIDLKQHLESVGTEPNFSEGFQLKLGEAVYEIDMRSFIVPGNSEVVVLFDSQSPSRNVGLEPFPFALLSGQRGAGWSALRAVIFNGVCFTALVLLLFCRCFY